MKGISSHKSRLLLAFWLLAAAPSALTGLYLLIDSGFTGDNFWFICLAVVASLLPALLWGWGLHAALRHLDSFGTAGLDLRPSLRLRLFFFFTLPLFTMLSVTQLFTLLAIILRGETFLDSDNDGINLVIILLSWALSLAYWLIRDLLTRKEERPWLSFKRMQRWMSVASITTLFSSVLVATTANLYDADIGYTFTAFLVGLIFLPGLYYVAAASLFKRLRVENRPLTEIPLKIFLRRAIITAGCLIACIAVIVQQLGALGEHTSFVDNQIKQQKIYDATIQKIANAPETFEAELEKTREQLERSKKLIPLYLGESETFGDEVEKSLARHGIKVTATYTNATPKFLHIVYRYVWQVTGDSRQLLAALREIDRSPRIVNWDWLPEGIVTPGATVNDILAATTYRLDSVVQRTINSRNAAPRIQRVYDNTLPKVWLPPFSGAADDLKRKFVEFFAAIPPHLAQHEKTFKDVKDANQQLETALKVAGDLGSNVETINWYLKEMPFKDSERWQRIHEAKIKFITDMKSSGKVPDYDIPKYSHWKN